jgi:hypothetical protein
MLEENYTIWFVAKLDDTELKISLIAEVATDPLRRHYYVRNIRHVRALSSRLLPDMLIEKIKGLWVYSDCGRENNLTIVVGQAIDQHEQTVMSAQRNPYS